jgi:hypothetical protein
MTSVSATTTFAPWYETRRGPGSPSMAAPAVPQAFVAAVVGTLINGTPRSWARALAQSITAPPPHAITTSACCARPMALKASTDGRVFSTCSPCSTW